MDFFVNCNNANKTAFYNPHINSKISQNDHHNTFRQVVSKILEIYKMNELYRGANFRYLEASKMKAKREKLFGMGYLVPSLLFSFALYKGN